MAKVFQVLHGHSLLATLHQSIEETNNLDGVFVEAPDYVFESWGFGRDKDGDFCFFEPIPPDGWEYDENNGTFYKVGG